MWCKSNKWYIKHKIDGTYHNHWLGYGYYQAGFYSELSERAIWKLIPQNGAMKFKIKCYYNDAFKGWLGFAWKGRWNKLYHNEGNAFVYKLEP